ncbi:hypothetical protein [Streptomyces sp. NPDC058412]|uniref:hypothetical protein n=1 Tax=Streptomyces sp. NPDC058412 TaxID=3346486 RepID=UPI00364F6430
MTAVKPPLDTFCNSSNGCNAGSPPQCTTEDCYKQYWYHANATLACRRGIRTGGSALP